MWLSDRNNNAFDSPLDAENVYEKKPPNLTMKI